MGEFPETIGRSGSFFSILIQFLIVIFEFSKSREVWRDVDAPRLLTSEC